jgi:peptidoglycan-associated lipoprotein
VNKVSLLFVLSGLFLLSGCIGNESNIENVKPRDSIVSNQDSSSSSESVVESSVGNISSIEISPKDIRLTKPNSPEAAAVNELKEKGVKFTLYFSFDGYSISNIATDEIIKHANLMKEYPNLKLRLEGHADERGTREYNLALGENRALAVKDVLELYGLGSRTEVISYGEEKPISNDSNEEGWKKNRRVDFIYE